MRLLDEAVTTAYRTRSSKLRHAFTPLKMPPLPTASPARFPFESEARGHLARRLGIIALTAAMLLFVFALAAGDADDAIPSVVSIARALASGHEALTDALAGWMTGKRPLD